MRVFHARVHVHPDGRGPLAPPSLCNGLTLPVVAFEQVYSFTSDELIAAIGKPEGMSDKRFTRSSNELLRRVKMGIDSPEGHPPWRVFREVDMRAWFGRVRTTGPSESPARSVEYGRRSALRL